MYFKRARLSQRLLFYKICLNTYPTLALTHVPPTVVSRQVASLKRNSRANSGRQSLPEQKKFQENIFRCWGGDARSPKWATILAAEESSEVLNANRSMQNCSMWLKHLLTDARIRYKKCSTSQRVPIHSASRTSTLLPLLVPLNWH